MYSNTLELESNYTVMRVKWSWEWMGACMGQRRPRPTTLRARDEELAAVALWRGGAGLSSVIVIP